MREGDGGAAIEVDHGADFFRGNIGEAADFPEPCSVDEIVHDGVVLFQFGGNGMKDGRFREVAGQDAKGCDGFLRQFLKALLAARDDPDFVHTLPVQCMDVFAAQSAGSACDNGNQHDVLPFRCMFVIVSYCIISGRVALRAFR